MAVIRKIRKGGVDNPLVSDAQNVSYSGSVSGATNVKEALDLLSGSSSVSSGPLQEASTFATTHNNAFVWILIDEDENENVVRKAIFHVGDGVFIDALGAVVE